jgi:hypothetical protein
MKKIIILAVAIAIFSIAVVHAAQYNITFSWDKNSEPDLSGYKLYQSEASGTYINDPVADIAKDANIYTLPLVINNTNMQYFVLTAYDNYGNESGYSNEVVFVPDNTPPGAPVLFNSKSIIIIIN